MEFKTIGKIYCTLSVALCLAQWICNPKIQICYLSISKKSGTKCAVDLHFEIVPAQKWTSIVYFLVHMLFSVVEGAFRLPADEHVLQHSHNLESKWLHSKGVEAWGSYWQCKNLKFPVGARMLIPFPKKNIEMVCIHRGNQVWKRHVHPNVHRSTVYHSQDMEAT